MLYFVAAPSHLNFEFCHWLLCCLSHLMRFMALPTTQLLLLQELSFISHALSLDNDLLVGMTLFC